MNVLRFETQAPPAAPTLGRADVACFVGFVWPRCGPAELATRFVAAQDRGRLRHLEAHFVALISARVAEFRERLELDPDAVLDLDFDLDARAARSLLELALPVDVIDGFERLGWLAGGRAAPRLGRGLVDLATLRDVPVAVDSWTGFDALFRTERDLADERGLIGTVATRLAAAVRSFFAAGGRRAWIVRVGDPEPCLVDVKSPKDARAAERAAARASAIASLLPGFPGRMTSTGADPASWGGAGHLLGLEEVSFLALPDLVELVGDPPKQQEDAPPAQEERFVPCTTRAPDQGKRPLRRNVAAPRCDPNGFDLWARAVNRAALFLRERAPEVQLVAAVPLAREEERERHRTLDALAGSLAGDLDGGPIGIASAFVQLVHPWLQVRDAGDLPELLEGGEGVLLGTLARSVLARGSWRSAAGALLPTVVGVERPLSLSELALSDPAQRSGVVRELTLRERVVLVHRTPRGWELASDVTTSRVEGHRPAGIGRLIASVLRAARLEGTADAFEPNGEALWTRVRDRLETLLEQFVAEGALRGPAPFRVRCDRSTMSQSDLDAGRVVVEVELEPTVGIERITVRLALREGARATSMGAAG